MFVILPCLKHAIHDRTILPSRRQLNSPFLYDVLTSCQRSSLLRSSRSHENINTTIKYFPTFKLSLGRRRRSHRGSPGSRASDALTASQSPPLNYSYLYEYVYPLNSPTRHHEIGRRPSKIK
ncbi:unnamed protein product [Trichogramma brassicae]|uniref:Uncharacterized protein n=1 Tax=Trichogramma brassicae TaxID=86971 RepID=A0A6H5IUE1_9HYME|nr:unnamed protein product [Trichogramma brassicae]